MQKKNLDRLLAQLDENMPIYQAIEILTGIKQLKKYDPADQTKQTIITTAIIGGLMTIGGMLTRLLWKKRCMAERLNQIIL